MLRFAVTTLLAISFAVILDLRGADAAAISADLYLSQFCPGCTTRINDTVTRDLDLLISTETTTHDFTACTYYGEFYCKNSGDNLANETETEIKNSLNAQLASEISDLQILAEYQPEYKESGGCSAVAISKVKFATHGGFVRSVTMSNRAPITRNCSAC